jgi:hypothetical protein
MGRAKEPIDEDLLLPVPREIASTPVLAYRLESVLGSTRRRGKALKWTAQGLVLGELLEPEHAEATETNNAETDPHAPLCHGESHELTR